jgi:hypothetical protein
MFLHHDFVVIEKDEEIPENMVQNYGAQDVVQNTAHVLVFATSQNSILSNGFNCQRCLSVGFREDSAMTPGCGDFRYISKKIWIPRESREHPLNQHSSTHCQGDRPQVDHHFQPQRIAPRVSKRGRS